MPLRDSEGNIFGILATSEDITQRKEAEEALIAQEHFISAIAETSPAIIYVYDMGCNCNVYVNSGVERLLGYSTKEIQAMGETVLSDLVHPDDFSKVLEIHSQISTATDEAILTIEYRMQHRDGTWRFLHSDERVFLRKNDGSVKQKIGIAFDITERKEVEAVLRQTQKSLIEAQRIAKIGSWEWDIATGKIYWSDAMFPVFGLEPQEPTYDLIKSLIHPDEVDWWEDHLVEMLEKSHTVFDIDYRIIQPDGNIAWIHNEADVQRYDNGTLIRMVGTSQDITERKLAEIALQKLNTELDDRVHKRTVELRKMVNMMAGREVRMSELKGIIRQLHAQLEAAGLEPVADDPLMSEST
jgi:PAS domain S-box-containing protein